MSLTVVKQPQGYILGTTANAATITSSSGALFTKAGHGLSTGDTIYVYSAFEAYNGYWYVSVVTGNTFRIREYSSASDVAYINSGSATYYTSSYTHGWNCVHLPIVYKIKSNVWPTNGADTARSITTFSNYNGYTYIQASGDIKATGTASSLEQVILTGTSVDGVYKIIQWFSDTNFVINLTYSAGNVLSSGTVQYYYFNYCAKIQIYGGLPAAHTWTAQKPYILLATIKQIPDSSGIITLNIAEYLKKQIEIISNNTILETLPNNIDAYCQFYISVAESYDDSNMYTVSEYTSAYTSDVLNFEGYAVNSKLPFKSREQGSMTKYLNNSGAILQKWLTNFTRPSMWAGKYFDISYIRINGLSSSDYIQRKVYIAGVLKEIFIDTVTASSPGVYRYSLTQSGWAEDTIILTYYSSGNVQLSESITIDVVQECSQQDFYVVWLNNLGGYDYWNFTARKRYAIDVTESKTQKTNIYNNYPNSYGEFADSIVKQTVRTGKNQLTITSQFVTADQEDAIKLLTTSPLVQICTSQYDRRTILIGSNTLPVRRDQDKTRKLTFSVDYTDDLPSQSL